MAEFKIKPVPAILVTVLLLAAVYRFWYYNKAAEAPSSDLDAVKDELGGHSEILTLNTRVLNFFNVTENDGIKVTWAHAVNSKEKLDAALKDTVMMIEADVQLRVLDGEPVMSHGTEDITSSSMSLREWLQRVWSNTGKGIKLDIKSTAALEPSIKILNEVKTSITGPIWINADVLKGPNAEGVPPVDAKTFFELTDKISFHPTLSVGWTTGYKSGTENEVYTKEMVDAMNSYCRGINPDRPITFPVRASLTAKSISNFERLIGNSKRYSLTVWHSEEDELSTQDLILIRKSFKIDQVFYDLPGKKMSEFSNALEGQQR